MLSYPHNLKGKSMSRFARSSHVLWHCQYHIVWTPKYRYRVLKGNMGRDVYGAVMIYCEQQGCEVVELNVQVDHVHLLVKIPPKLSVSKLVGVLKGRTAIRLFNKYPHLRKKPFWGNHFWAKGYCVDTVGVDSEMIRKYVKYQQKQEELQQQLDFKKK